MLLDIKKLFTKDTTLGRFEYLKLVWGLILFPILLIELTIIIPPNNSLCYVVFALTVITWLIYLIIWWVATYKRLKNIFDNTAISVVSMIIFIFSEIVVILHAIFMLLLVVIPGKKKTDNIISSKLFWITFPLVILFVFSFQMIGINRIIPAESMANTLKPRDRIILNILDKDFHRGDIVIHATDKKRVDYVKRIIALPGEKVEIKALTDGSYSIYINDEKLDEPYVKSIYEYQKLSNVPYASMIVPNDSYYVMGDNRGNSYDSRYYGAVHKDLIKGKVSHIWYPISRRQVFKTP